jgi:hypothetical protein
MLGKIGDEIQLALIRLQRTSVFPLSNNMWSLGWVSSFKDVSSEMIYPLLPFRSEKSSLDGLEDHLSQFS